jgi:tetratricopeptide (TPR) repeat protein
MKKLFCVLSLFVLISFALLTVLQTGCRPAKSDEVPVTTKSKEARELFIQGRDLAEKGHTEKANELFTQAVQKDPEFALAYLFKAGTSPDTKEGKAAFAKALSLVPNASPGEQKLLAAEQAAYQENNTVKYNQIYQELAAMFPKDKHIQWYLGGSYDGLAEYDKEIAAYEQALAIDKNFAPAYQSLGYIYRWKNQYDKADANFQEYLKLNPKEPSAHVNLADLYRKMGKFEDALQHYKEAVQIDPLFREAQLKVGTTLAFTGKCEEARQALQKIMDGETKPAFKLYDQQDIARMYVYEGDYAKALEATDKAIQMAQELGLPEQVAFNHQVKSFLFFELNDWDKAESSFAEVLKTAENADLAPATKEFYRAASPYWQALVAAGRKDFKAALAKADEFKAKIEAIKNPVWQKFPGWLLGYIAYAQGDYNRAVQNFSQGEMDDVWIMYYFAAAKEKAGDAAGASELYKKVANWNLDDVWYAFVRQKAASKVT